MRITNRSHPAILALSLMAAAAVGCAKGDEAATDTSAAAAATTAPDSGMGGMNRPAARDADQEFLRMMADHHEGMIQMGNAAMTKGSTPAVQGDAHMMHTMQMDEQKKMMGMLQTSYGESPMPMLMPSNKAMMDALGTKTGPDYDRAFYLNVIAHHEEAVKMVNDMMPKLANTEVKQMAQMMKDHQVKEIAALKKKVK